MMPFMFGYCKVLKIKNPSDRGMGFFINNAVIYFFPGDELPTRPMAQRNPI